MALNDSSVCDLIFQLAIRVQFLMRAHGKNTHFIFLTYDTRSHVVYSRYPDRT